MTLTKRVFALVMVIALSLSVVVMPASAATNPDFYHFPLVTESMGNGYMSAAVAVQKFLMLYSSTSYNLVRASGGTDGYFGSGSASAAAYFQHQERLTDDGKIGYFSWGKICELLNYKTGIDSDASYYFLGNNSGAYIPDNRVIVEAGGYRSVNYQGLTKEIFYS